MENVTFVAAVTYVVAVIVNGRDEVLLLKRSRSATLGPGQWGLPGGHLRPGEEVSAGMRRELREELGRGMRLRLLSRLGPIAAVGMPGSRAPSGPRIHLFHFRHLAGGPDLNAEHTAWAWADRESFASFAVLPGVAEDLACFRVWPPR